MTDSASTIEHRTFLLTLDREDGDEIASLAGFTSASEDVYDRERDQVAKDWALMEAEGLLPQLLQYATWFADVAIGEDYVTDADRELTVSTAVTFAASAIARLKHRGYVETPSDKRLIAVLRDPDGSIRDHRIPEELMEHAADLYAWRHDEEEL